uniref:Uncharacterized protein n=1 Tax=Leersia perrieri TaxID=77586 RepID=A0A0D9VYG1_9ORYZ
MAPTASMLFLSYHQLHRPAAAVEEEGSNGRVRVNLSSIALPFFARRTESAAEKPETRRGGGGVAGEVDREEPDSAAAASLESRFEEAVRLSCWSS